ncbi:MAG: hypothetical protein VST69_04825, partial [Nitrospirota bacterium]|nr:hypothetical protein [Nitrospirota bacterium]
QIATHRFSEALERGDVNENYELDVWTVFETRRSRGIVAYQGHITRFWVGLGMMSLGGWILLDATPFLWIFNIFPTINSMFIALVVTVCALVGIGLLVFISSFFCKKNFIKEVNKFFWVDIEKYDHVEQESYSEFSGFYVPPQDV